VRGISWSKGLPAWLVAVCAGCDLLAGHASNLTYGHDGWAITCSLLRGETRRAGQAATGDGQRHWHRRAGTGTGKAQADYEVMVMLLLLLPTATNYYKLLR
jgi:hypothetical protein